MAVRVAINGFGRTGRAAFRAAFESGADIEWVAINDVADAGDARPPAQVRHRLRPVRRHRRAGRGRARRRRDRIETPTVSDPAALPWGELGVEVVIESSGRFRARADAEKHLEAGAKKVIVSAPAKEPDVTVALGVNFETLRPRATPDHLERVVHDELPRPGREGPARGARHPPRRHDHRARVHRRPAAARRAAQGLPACPRRGCEPRSHLHRRCEGDRPGRPGARGEAAGLRGTGAAPTGSLVDLTLEMERRRPSTRSTPSSSGAPTAASSPASCATARSRSSRPTSSSRRTRRSSTRR